MTDTLTRTDGTPVMLRGDEEMNDSVRAALFGVLADLAAPIVEHYRSDMYHDAHWISQRVSGPVAFTYVVRPWGTHIGIDEDTLRSGWSDIGGADGRLYIVTLAHESTHPGGPPWRWTAAVSDITPS